ncbi:MAG: HdeD family acid-resistance protein, partial [Acetobacteraceae bacterium]
SGSPSPSLSFRRPRSNWIWFVVLGVLQILLGVFCWFDALAATLAGTIFIGAALVVGGALQIVHAFLDRGWGGFLLHVLSGVLYAIGGFLIMAEPVQGSIVLTIILAALLIVAGVTRVALSVSHWHLGGSGLLLLGGLVSIGVGVGLYVTLPWSGLWVLGTLIAIELILHGAAWFEFGFALRRLGRVAP